MKFISLVLALPVGMLISQPIFAQEKSESAKPVEVMVVASWHMAGSDRNVVDVPGPDVLTSERQAQFEDVVAKLAKFEPTVVAIEREGMAPDYHDPSYPLSTDEDFASDPSEMVQLGFRLAKHVGLADVHAIDEQTRVGDPYYFPYNKLRGHIEQTGRLEELQALEEIEREMLLGAMRRYESIPIADALIDMSNLSIDFGLSYYEFSDFDTGELQPGAELQAYWFMRNAKIFSKLMDVAEPGDRIVVIFGAGHKYWLDHMIERTRGYELVDPLPYLSGQ